MGSDEAQQVPETRDFAYYYTFSKYLPDIQTFGLRGDCRFARSRVDPQEAKRLYGLHGKLRDVCLVIDLAKLRELGFPVSDPHTAAVTPDPTEVTVDVGRLFGESLSDFWERKNAETESWNDAFRAVAGIEELYAAVADDRRCEIAAELAEWLDSDNGRKRYDAIVLVRRLHLTSALPRLTELVDAAGGVQPKDINWAALIRALGEAE